ncbi:MAG: Fic family protein [Thermomicrobiales bacterium]
MLLLSRKWKSSPQHRCSSTSWQLMNSVGALGQSGVEDWSIKSLLQRFQVYGDHDPHPGAFDKAAMLLRGITQGHPFEDGNKRTGFLTAALYLDLVGYPLPARLPVDDVVQFSLQVSSGMLRDVR